MSLCSSTSHLRSRVCEFRGPAGGQQKGTLLAPGWQQVPSTTLLAPLLSMAATPEPRCCAPAWPVGLVWIRRGALRERPG